MASPKRRPGWGGVLITLYFWTAFLVTAPVGLLLGGLAFLVALPFDPDRRLVHAFLTRWCFDYLRLNPLWKVEVRFRDRIPARPCVFILNHRSMADVVAAMGLYGTFKFVSKASLFRLPAVGWMMRLARYVELERGQLSSTRRMWAACRAFLERGVSILLFPEGTYATGPEGTLLPFRRGAFALAIELGVPIVPVTLEGTSSLVHEDGPWMNARARVRITVLPPLMPDALGTDAQALADRVRDLMTAALQN